MVNIAVSGDLERRHFTAVMGLKRRDSRGRVKGELFSFENMFVIRQESNCLTEDILKVRACNGCILCVPRRGVGMGRGGGGRGREGGGAHMCLSPDPSHGSKVERGLLDCCHI